MTIQSLTDKAVPTFETRSEKHVAILEAVAEERQCACVPYEDFFTYQVWQQLGYQVQKGQKGTRLTTYIGYDKEGKDGKVKHYTRPKGYTVFCACQIKPKE